jgi:AcrR family transcriptional regulator
MAQQHASAAEPEPAVDGRRLRAERNREGVILAILELLNEGIERPTTTQIAERSGVSVRSVFRHFEDVESLWATAFEFHAAKMAPLYKLPPLEGDFEHRLAGFVEHRERLFEAMGTVRRSAERLRGTSPTIASKLELSRTILLYQLESIFAPEIEATPEDRQRAVRDSLEAMTSWHAWEVLTRIQGCSPERAADAMATAIRAILSPA